MLCSYVQRSIPVVLVKRGYLYDGQSTDVIVDLAGATDQHAQYIYFKEHS